MTELQTLEYLSGIWKRIFALVIDATLLFMICFILGYFFEKQFAGMGGWGKIFGLLLATSYFGFFNSRILGGQTIGKIFLKIKVVDTQGNTISLPKSIARALIFWTPIMLNGANFSSTSLLSWLAVPLSACVFGGIFALIYLVIFNRKTQQALHDIITHTYVINLGLENRDFETIWKPHIYIVSGFFILFSLMPFGAKILLNRFPPEDFKTSLTALEERSEINIVSFGVSYVIKATNQDETKKSFSYVDIYLNEDKTQDIAYADELAKQIVEMYPGAKTHDYLLVNLHYGYNIGFWAYWLTSSKRYEF